MQEVAELVNSSSGVDPVLEVSGQRVWEGHLVVVQGVVCVTRYCLDWHSAEVPAFELAQMSAWDGWVVVSCLTQMGEVDEGEPD